MSEQEHSPAPDAASDTGLLVKELPPLVVETEAVAAETLGVALNAVTAEIAQLPLPAKPKKKRAKRKTKRKKRQGIKPGTHANSEASLRLERDLAIAVPQFVRNSGIEGLTWQQSLTGKRAFPLLIKPNDARKNHQSFEDEAVVGMKPDGGIVYYLGVPVVAFEAKKQNDRGNAFDRWYKNFYLWSHLNFQGSLMYVTFLTGPGCEAGGVMSRSCRLVLTTTGRVFNKLYPAGPSFYRSIDAFPREEIDKVVSNAVLMGLEQARWYHD